MFGGSARDKISETLSSSKSSSSGSPSRSSRPRKPRRELSKATKARFNARSYFLSSILVMGNFLSGVVLYTDEIESSFACHRKELARHCDCGSDCRMGGLL